MRMTNETEMEDGVTDEGAFRVHLPVKSEKGILLGLLVFFSGTLSFRSN